MQTGPPSVDSRRGKIFRPTTMRYLRPRPAALIFRFFRCVAQQVGGKAMMTGGARGGGRKERAGGESCHRRRRENPPAFGLSPHLITAPNPAVHRPVRAQRGPARGDSLAGWLAGCADGAKRAQGGSAPTAALGTHGFDYSRGQGQLFWLPCRRSRAWAPYMSSRFFFADRYVETGAPYTVVRRAHRIAG
jgi:hypothetical protein